VASPDPQPTESHSRPPVFARTRTGTTTAAAAESERKISADSGVYVDGHDVRKLNVQDYRAQVRP
jgi:hypothetical protein